MEGFMIDFIDQIRALSDKVVKLKDQIKTEEATKNALILPFIQILGYDIFNPIEVIPEFVSDIGTKKGEKVDYVILKDGKPIILIECKWWGEDLNAHNSQVVRYFHTTESRFAIITNGINYQFYSDLENANKLDKKPFLEFDISDVRERTVNELKKFKKDNFDLDSILYCANELKYSTEIRSILASNLNDPSEEFVRFFTKKVYPGRVVTAKVLEQFKGIVKNTASNFINDLIHDRIKSAINREEDKEQVQEDIDTEEEETTRIVTTEEELEGYYIVKTIIRPYVDSDRITYKDTVRYFAIILDGNNHKQICRLRLNSQNRCITYQDDKKERIKIPIERVDDIYKHSEALIQQIKRLIADDVLVEKKKPSPEISE